MSCESDLTQELRELGFRVTPQRRVILHILLHANGHLTPSEVFALAQESLPGLMETTVYRTLEFLVQTGLAQAAFGSNGKRAYEISDEHHHHLICRQCGKEIEIPHVQLDSLYASLEASTQFKLVHNHITFLGLCAECQ
ncbi:MAG: transcriptional repressor [Anaerolineae bacterium]|jgi:Fur family transcriptional regulator, ferric uptake regulator|nr:transcriptional repressor [Anaerolineae bacterium]MBT7069832.1 transcriptional repressor [Anaerolineae bacterium]MBT7325780.1 transcriptional repressor [Anaerolineae bacterium]